MSYSKDIGHWAEDQAVAHIQQQGFTIVTRNFLCRGGEVDIIATQGNHLVFVEVKYRRHNAMGGAISAITSKKQKRLLLAANIFLQQQPRFHNYACRFDFVGISGGTAATVKLQWLENIFIAAN